MVKRKKLRAIKTKTGVDPKLERAADKILKANRIEEKRNKKAFNYKKNTRDRKEALLTPSETIVKVRDERLLKKMAAEAKPTLRKLTPTTRKMVARRTQAALTARAKAKEFGKRAAVSIAKARAAKEKKAPLTKMAENMNTVSNQNRKEARELTKYLAYDEGYYTKTKKGNRYLKKRVLDKQAQLSYQGSKVNPIYSMVKDAEEYSRISADTSKWAARKSGGYATSMKRNAEAGISSIASGRAMKRVARAGGALGMVSMFASHLMGNKEKKRG